MKIHFLLHVVKKINIYPLFFSVPPTIDPMTDIVANAGDKVDLECVVGGAPTPIVEWYYRGSYYNDQKVILKEYDFMKVHI